MKTYTKVAVSVFALLMVCAVAFNWAVDPYRVFGDVAPVEYYEPNTRLWKTRVVRSRHAEFAGYIMGNSRAAQFPAAALSRPGAAFFNYATSSECPNETYSKLAYLYRTGVAVKELVLFVSVDSFGEIDLDEPHDLLRQEHPAVRGRGTMLGLACRYLLSTEGISRSFEALACRREKRKAMGFSADGTVTYQWACTEKQFAESNRQQSRPFDREGARKLLDWHRKIADLAREHGTRVCVVIAPFPGPAWDRYDADHEARGYLASLGAVYGVAPLRVESEELYNDYRHWNDPAHCTREALERFFLPRIREYFTK